MGNWSCAEFKVRFLLELLSYFKAYRKSKCFVGDNFWPQGDDYDFDEVAHDNGFFEIKTDANGRLVATPFLRFMQSYNIRTDKRTGELIHRKLDSFQRHNLLEKAIEDFRQNINKFIDEYALQDIKIPGITPWEIETMLHIPKRKIPLFFLEQILEKIVYIRYGLVWGLAAMIISLKFVWLEKALGSAMSFFEIEKPEWLPEEGGLAKALLIVTIILLDKAWFPYLEKAANKLERNLEKDLENFLKSRLRAYVLNLDKEGLKARRKAVDVAIRGVRESLGNKKNLDMSRQNEIISGLKRMLGTFREDEPWFDRVLIIMKHLSTCPLQEVSAYTIAVAVLAEIEDANPEFIEQYLKDHPSENTWLNQNMQELATLQSRTDFVNKLATARGKKEIEHVMIETPGERADLEHVAIEKHKRILNAQIGNTEKAFISDIVDDLRELESRNAFRVIISLIAGKDPCHGGVLPGT